MGRMPRHAQRDEAVALAAEVGLSEAAARYGISYFTLRLWCIADGVQWAPSRQGRPPGSIEGYAVGKRALSPHVREDGTVDVACWCKRRIVLAPIDDVRDGRTASCGRRDCGPEQVAS